MLLGGNLSYPDPSFQKTFRNIFRNVLKLHLNKFLGWLSIQFSSEQSLL